MYLSTLVGGFSYPSDGKSAAEKNKELTQETIEDNKVVNKSKTKTYRNNRYSKTSKEMSDSERNLRKIIKSKRKEKISDVNKQVKVKSATNLKIFSTNGAGVIRGKIKSLHEEVKHTQANIVTLQETHCTLKGKMQMDPSFVVFEAIRKKKGGGTMIAINQDLNPKLVEEYSDDFEMLVVEIDTKENAIRVISGYGPQENWDEENRIPFFIALEKEIERAEIAGKSVIIEIDANSKLGKDYIPKDPHDITPNGRLLAAIIERHNLIVGNGSTNCTGTITRCRRTKKTIEKSVIDFVLFSNDLKNHFKSMHIDEERKHVLTKIRKSKKGTKKKESDHNVIITEFKCEVIEKEDTEKEEAYNLKNKDSQANFREYTNKTKMLSSVLDGEGDVTQLTNRLLKKINGCIAMNFKKQRVNRSKPMKTNHLYNRMRELKGKEDDQSKDELKKVIDEIADEEETKYEQVKDALKDIKTGDRGLNSKEVWKLKKKLFPKSHEPPSVMKDEKGNLLTSDKAILDLGLKTFAKRLEPNQIEPNLEQFEKETNEVCEIRLKLSKNNKTNMWTMDDLKYVLKQLDNDKSRDTDGFANEIFKVAGEDLLEAVLKLMNIIKERQEYPRGLENCNITTIHKKLSKKEFKNYRGVFRVAVLRSILDKLMYHDSYYTIDNNLTDGNVGARKQIRVHDKFNYECKFRTHTSTDHGYKYMF